MPPNSKAASSNGRPRLTQEVRSVHGWPSNTFAIRHHSSTDDGRSSLPEQPHTLLVFIPGNPGLIEWYIPSFFEIIKRLGPGYAACGVSNAGHGLHDDIVSVQAWDEEDRRRQREERSTCVPWTVDGQIAHKIAYMDLLEDDFCRFSKKGSKDTDSLDDPRTMTMPPRYVFVSHSIGAHFTQRLCVLRPDILDRTALLIHLTPFVRMKAPRSKQMLLDLLARNPATTISIHERLMHLLRILPVAAVDTLFSLAMKDGESRQIATRLVRQPAFAKNFFSLGLEEIRDVPEAFDVCAIRCMVVTCLCCVFCSFIWSPCGCL